MAWVPGPGSGFWAPGCRARIRVGVQNQDRGVVAWSRNQGVGVRGWDLGVGVQGQDWKLEVPKTRVAKSGWGSSGPQVWGGDWGFSDSGTGLSGYPWSSQGAERSGI